MSITIVIPTYNASPYLGETLESISGQERPPDEVIVVDDRSTDDTVEIVHRWAMAQTFAVRVLENQFSHDGFSSRGPAGGRNTGLHEARADLVALLDHDDLMLPSHLRLTEQALLRYPDMQLCFGDAVEFGSGVPGGERSVFEGKPIAELAFEESPDGEGLRIFAEPILQSLSGGSYIPTAANLWRREMGIGVGGFDRRAGSCDDNLFFSRMSRRGRVGYYPFPIARKRAHGNNLSDPRHSLQLNIDSRNILETLLDDREPLNLTEREQAVILRNLAEARQGVLYHASRKGWGTYSQLRKTLGDGGPMEPKDVLRALAWSARAYFDGDRRERSGSA